MRTVVLSSIAAALFLSGAVDAQNHPPAWTLVPELRIGSLDGGSDALSHVSDVTVSPSGQMYVAQPQEHRIRVFDARGRYLRSIGRRGGGPGEFQGLVFLGWRGDTIYGVDAAQQRLSLFAADGRHVRTVRVTSGPLEGTFRPATPRALLADGTVLAQPPVPSGPVANGAITDVPVVQLDLQGRVLGTVGRVSWAGATAAIMTRDRVDFFRQPIVGTGIYAPARDGRTVVFVHRPLPTSARPSTFRVEVVRGPGQPVFSREYRYTPRAVPARIADSLASMHVDRLVRQGMTRPQAERAGRDALVLPRFQPPVTAVVSGRDGTIWLRLEDLGVAQVRWIVLDPEGNIVGTFAAPARMRILEANRRAVWAVVLDDLDVPYVTRYAVRPG